MTTATNSVLPSSWQHMIITYSGNSNVSGIKIWVNGVSMSLITILNTLAGSIKLNVNWRIGDDTTSDWFTGPMDDVRLYNRVLSETEIKAIYNSGTPRARISGRSRISGMKIK